jgi:hypothetical protein
VGTHLTAYVELSHTLLTDSHKNPCDGGVCEYFCLLFNNVFDLCSSLFQKGFKGLLFNIADKIYLKQVIKIRDG